MSPKVIYAIGDVHGMAGQLARLHEAIIDDIRASGAPSAIIHLGDYIDRGENSRGVIELVMGLGARVARYGATVHALRGNHEVMMLEAIDQSEPDAEPFWLTNGGDATLASYATRFESADWRAAIPASHIAWLRAQPVIMREGRYVFVHAGIEPAQFPDDSEDVYLWTRSRRFLATETWPERPEIEGICVVHGHTPTEDAQPFLDARRINIDTGAVYGGPLTCAVLAPGQPVRFFCV